MPFILQLSVSFVCRLLGRRSFFGMSLCHCQASWQLFQVCSAILAPTLTPSPPAWTQTYGLVGGTIMWHVHVFWIREMLKWIAAFVQISCSCSLPSPMLPPPAACILCNKFQRACFQQCRHFSCHCRFRFRLKSLGRVSLAMQSIKARQQAIPFTPCLPMLQINTYTETHIHTHTLTQCLQFELLKCLQNICASF